MLFRQVDLTELKKVQAERAERVGRLDAGLAATLAAIETFNQVKVPKPESIHQLVFTPADSASIAAEPGEEVAAKLTTAVWKAVTLRQEITTGEQAVIARRHEVEAALEAWKASFRRGIRITVRVGAFLLVVALFRSCTS